MEMQVQYQTHLERVSRSFAFCIPLLEARLRHQVSLAYLLFRVVDTIEDSAWPSPNEQMKAFNELIEFFGQKPDARAIADWLAQLPASVPAEEFELMNDTPVLFEDFHSLSPVIRELMRRSLIEMIRGMIHFSKGSRTGFQTLAELNQYCFFVAGIVGELLTGLVLGRPLALQDEKILLEAHHFGIFLQKINILKDQSKDEKEGRYFVPDRKAVVASLRLHAEHAFSYIRSIPEEHRAYKLFCAYSFFLALFSLPYIESSWLSKLGEKIPRALTQQYLQKVHAAIDSNQALEELYRKHAEPLKHTEPLKAREPVGRADNAESVDMPPWFWQCYGRPLSRQHLENLGLL